MEDDAMMKAAALLLPLLLAACASPQQLSAADDDTCRSFGTAPGSEAYTHCRLVQQARRDQQNAQFGESLRRAGQALQDQPRSPSVSCTTHRTMPGTYQTNC
jgi:hypothetical protein